MLKLVFFQLLGLWPVPEKMSDRGEAESIQQQLDIELKRLFQHFEEDEERTSRLALALEQESTAASLHFALFPRRTRDGGLQVALS